MATRRKVRFGIIGLGLMGREFASVMARWSHLLFEGPVPELAGICDTNPATHAWYTESFPGIAVVTRDYRELLESSKVDAIYCAVPHNLHEKLYGDIIRAGKHLMGEKPFGIDRAANAEILETVAAHPELFVRCSSEYAFYPGAQRIVRWAREGRFGRIVEVRAGLLHSSDMDVSKPINWKRTLEVNGQYGCMGDLGMHTHFIPLRLGWVPKRVFASLSKIVDSRPDGKGGMAPCLTWDNATLACTVEHAEGYSFPLFFEHKRMSPGMADTWYIEVDGMKASARFTTRDPNLFRFCLGGDKEQAWSTVEVGYVPAIPTITGNIFGFGFSDSLLQMWAAYLAEMDGGAAPGAVGAGFGCLTPQETRMSHAIMTAALASGKSGGAEPVDL